MATKLILNFLNAEFVAGLLYWIALMCVSELKKWPASLQEESTADTTTVIKREKKKMTIMMTHNSNKCFS